MQLKFHTMNSNLRVRLVIIMRDVTSLFLQSDDEDEGGNVSNESAEVHHSDEEMEMGEHEESDDRVFSISESC